MRFAPLLFALLLGACATAGPATPARVSGPGLSAQDRADPLRALSRAGAADAMTPHGAAALFGKADIERHDGAGAILTWRTAHCALVLAFAADARGVLRLGAADIAGRDQHAPAPPMDQCVREALARRAS
jgi:hypothetical protein